MDDASIIRLFLDRDSSALTELKNKYDRLCQYVAMNILSQHEDAEECVNSAYYEMWGRIPPEVPSDLRTYLCRIVRNKALDKLRYNTADKRNSLLTGPLEELSECASADTIGEVTAEELAGAISRFLRTQDEKHRKVFVRRYWYGDSLARIAECYGMKEQTVATYLFRTRKKLKTFLQKEGYYHE